MVLLQSVGDEDESVLEPESPSAGDAFDEKVPGVLERRQVLGIGPALQL